MRSTSGGSDELTAVAKLWDGTPELGVSSLPGRPPFFYIVETECHCLGNSPLDTSSSPLGINYCVSFDAEVRATMLTTTR